MSHYGFSKDGLEGRVHENVGPGNFVRLWASSSDLKHNVSTGGFVVAVDEKTITISQSYPLDAARVLLPNSEDVPKPYDLKRFQAYEIISHQ